jgi:prophage regulatory protein
MAHTPEIRILRRKQVELRTGLPRSTIYEKMSNGDFPKPIDLGQRAVGWIEAEVDAWLTSQVKRSRSKLAA